MGSGAMIYVPIFIKIGSGIRKLIGGTHREYGNLINRLTVLQNKESRLIKYVTGPIEGGGGELMVATKPKAWCVISEHESYPGHEQCPPA
jgi:hypothetical protein